MEIFERKDKIVAREDEIPLDPRFKRRHPYNGEESVGRGRFTRE
jgi:hypothetical protein